jgi:hypothetical protein
MNIVKAPNESVKIEPCKTFPKEYSTNVRLICDIKFSHLKKRKIIEALT